MNLMLAKDEGWSKRGWDLAVYSTVAAILLSLFDGLFHGPLSARYTGDLHTAGMLSMLSTWCYDLRQVADEWIFVGVVLFVGAKILETRSSFAIGFDRLDADKVSVKGPDGDNVVWIGHRYADSVEAQAVAETIGRRLKESA